MACVYAIMHEHSASAVQSIVWPRVQSSSLSLFQAHCTMADSTPSRRLRSSRWRPWESPTADDLSRRPLRPSTQYVVGKMLFKTVTLPTRDKELDSLAAVQAKVEECGKSTLTSRMVHCDEAESGKPGLTWFGNCSQGS